MSERRLECLSDPGEATVEVILRGSWDRKTHVAFSRLLRKCLVEQPRAVLVDVAHLDDPTGRIVPSLIDGYRAGGSVDPPVPLVVSGATGRLARRIQSTGLARSVATFPSLADSRRAVAAGVARPTMRRARFGPGHTEVALARDLVAQTCAEWNLGPIMHTARAVTSELVTNAVDHGGGGFTLTLSHRGRLLHVAVEDGTAALPRLRAVADRDPPLADRGRGLRLVADRAESWGARPGPGGKVVWATVNAVAAPLR